MSWLEIMHCILILCHRFYSSTFKIFVLLLACFSSGCSKTGTVFLHFYCLVIKLQRNRGVLFGLEVFVVVCIDRFESMNRDARHTIVKDCICSIVVES